MPNETTSPAANASPRLYPPKDGAIVRMYRIGHGDCFLLAFPGETEKKPVYVLIDCGYKPGSPARIDIDPPITNKEIAENIHAATGGTIDVAVITHEHQDHVNAITEKNFGRIKIRQTWLAWTENPKDDVANALRTRFKDKLLGLIAARNRLHAGGDPKKAAQLDQFLEFELGVEEDGSLAAALGVAAGEKGESANKKAMKLFKDLADDVKYLLPHEKVLSIDGAPGLRVFSFGPPRENEFLLDLDPVGEEQFHLNAARRVGFEAAALTETESPFAERFRVDAKTACDDATWGGFFSTHYGTEKCALKFTNTPFVPDSREAAENAPWRRIDNDWLYSAEQLALAMSSYTNNSSLVLAFELKKGGKVLLFAADAQRGNWVSWGKKAWPDGADKVTARDLLNRTVLYKVGHHGSHNATLNGTPDDEHANLGWMGAGEHAGEFAAMITAVRKWAIEEAGWDHPLPQIKEALLKKTSGRVFQTDTSWEEMEKRADTATKAWKAFAKRTTPHRLYFDYVVRS